MEWYLPITIIPGIGLIISSTSQLLIALNEEIRELNIEKEKFKLTIKAKLKQLRNLNYSLVAQYISAFLFVVGGILGEITNKEYVIIYFVFVGVIFLTIAIILLIQYSFRSISIRQKHLKI